jgi:outer membrane protein TolC
LLYAIATPAQEALTVEDAVKIGLKNNFDIRIARNESEIAKNTGDLGTSGFLPVLNASGEGTLSQSDQTSNSPFTFGNSETNSYGGRIDLNWTLFDGFAMFADNKRFNELARLGEFVAKDKIESSVVEIISGYFNLVQQEQLLDVAEDSREISRDRYEKEKVRQEVGGVSSAELLNAQVSFNQDEAAVLNQELNVEIAKQGLNILLGREPDSPIDVTKEIFVKKYEVEYSELKELLLKNNTRLNIAKQNKIIADKEVDLNRSFFYPSLFFNAAYGYTNRTVSSDRTDLSGDITTESLDGSVGLTLSFNLFNGFRDNINYQNSLIDFKNQELAFSKTQNEIEGQLTEKYVTYQKRLEFVELEEKNVIAAEQNLALQRDRYQTGSATSLEFRDAQLSLARAMATLIIARFQARIAVVELQRLVGVLDIE